MRKSKKEKSATKGEFGLDGPVRQEDGLYMSSKDLLKVELAQAKATMALQAIALAKGRIESNRREYEEKIRKLEAEQEESLKNAQVELAAVVHRSKTLEEAAQKLWVEMSAIYEVDFRSASYDDETGKITTNL